MSMKGLEAARMGSGLPGLELGGGLVERLSSLQQAATAELSARPTTRRLRSFRMRVAAVGTLPLNRS